MPPEFVYMEEQFMGKNIGVIPICSHCETGRKDYELDRKSLFCSHINCLKNGKCDKYKPIMHRTRSNSRNRVML